MHTAIKPAFLKKIDFAALPSQRQGLLSSLTLPWRLWSCFSLFVCLSVCLSVCLFVCPRINYFQPSDVTCFLQNSKGCRSLDVIRRSLTTSSSIRPMGVQNFRLHTGSALNIADYLDYYRQRGELRASDAVLHSVHRLRSWY